MKRNLISFIGYNLDFVNNINDFAKTNLTIFLSRFWKAWKTLRKSMQIVILGVWVYLFASFGNWKMIASIADSLPECTVFVLLMKYLVRLVEFKFASNTL